MPQGITVLNKEEIISISSNCLLLAYILFFTGIIAIIAGFIIINIFNKDRTKTVFNVISAFITYLGFALMVISILIVVVPDFVFKQRFYKTGKYEYKVIIDDTAKFKEIYDKYDIIEMEGKIYTISDKF